VGISQSRVQQILTAAEADDGAEDPWDDATDEALSLYTRGPSSK
jgi:hypothetical protein